LARAPAATDAAGEVELRRGFTIVDRNRWIERYLATRAETERLAAPLSDEDQMLQAMADASPVKWHRAHTTWFFETFVLLPSGAREHHPQYRYLFNSYYEAVGPRHPRPQRGLLSRPSARDIDAYRRAVDGRVVALLDAADDDQRRRLAPTLALGIAHEEQHQELILTDVLAALAANALEPVYVAAPAGEAAPEGDLEPPEWVEHQGGLVHAGAKPESGFAFDNESPSHRVFLEPFALASRPIVNAEVLAFARDGGYRRASLWLSEGWDWVQRSGAAAPGYTEIDADAGAPTCFGLHGRRPASLASPAAHLSYYEADAIARWLGARLPTEIEWEHRAERLPVAGHFRDDGWLVPRAPGAASARSPNHGLFGDVWEWTSSAYGPYPGFAAGDGALGEYNGKFMVGQMVLRGGSCLSNRAHLRATYRNFWPPATRFQMSGARLARDLR